MDALYRFIANILPNRVVYFCYVRVHAYATTTKYSNTSPDEVTWQEALECWEEQGG